MSSVITSILSPQLKLKHLNSQASQLAKMVVRDCSSSLPAVFYRGGTSKALMIHRRHLPRDEKEWAPILAGAIGSPDPYQRQLNGMGGGISSLSKICVIDKSTREDADVDYTFVQMGVVDGQMDMAGTCGNMTSAVGPFTLDEGLLDQVIPEEEPNGQLTMTVRINNTNTNKIIHATFSVLRETDVGGRYRFQPYGTYSIDGVPGTGSRITMSFLSPGGSKTGTTLPTGRPVDTIDLSKAGLPQRMQSRPPSIPCSLIDVGNPAVIISTSDVGITGDIRPEDLDHDVELMSLLEEIRKQGSLMMGMEPVVESIPKMVLVSPPPTQRSSTTSCKPNIGDKPVYLTARVLSMGRCHKAIPLTIALNLGVACNIPGSIPHSLSRQCATSGDAISIGHPSGVLEVGAQMKNGDVERGVLHRTARPLMKGEVYWRNDDGNTSL